MQVCLGKALIIPTNALYNLQPQHDAMPCICIIQSSSMLGMQMWAACSVFCSEHYSNAAIVFVSAQEESP